MISPRSIAWAMLLVSREGGGQGEDRGTQSGVMHR